MKKYTKPKIYIKKIKLNMFLGDNNIRSPHSNFTNLFKIPQAYASDGSIHPPDTGNAGLKDPKMKKIFKS